jgi:flagellar hook assembly protein FlgD
MDGDGDLDLLIGDRYGKVTHYKNTGSKTAPQWTLVGPLQDAGGKEINGGLYAAPTFADVNGDGLSDLLIGDYYGKVTHYENTGSAIVPQWTSKGFLKDGAGTDIDIGSSSVPSLADIDHDGDLDLFLGYLDGLVTFYRNTGTKAAPMWTQVGPLTDKDGKTIDVGHYSTPAFADLDGDGDVDLFTGEFYGKITFYENVGQAASPSWKFISTKYDYLGVDSRSAPAPGDLDGDGDVDLLIGDSTGKLFLFTNGGAAAQPRWVPSGSLVDAAATTIKASPCCSVPVLADLDGDGDLDLLIGQSGGNIVHYRNDGDATAAQWVLVGDVSDAANKTINVGSYSAPAVADIDDDGDLDLFVGEVNGQVFHYRNDGNAAQPSWTYLGALKDSGGKTIDVGSFSRPALADVDRDGTLDLLIGDYNGKISPYANIGSPAAAVFTLTSSDYRGIKVSQYASPALFDVGNDGDADLFVGETYGSLHYYPTLGCTQHQYTSTGTYPATFRVTDNSGLKATAKVSVRVFAAGAPSVNASAAPASGTVPLTVTLNGKVTDANGSIVKYEWDFNGDGTYDWSSSSSAATTHTYDRVGSFKATLRVTDSEGKKATAAVTVTANLGVATRRTGLLNTSSGGQADICETLSDNATVTLRVVDGNGQPVKTIVSNAARVRSTEYCDAWNGTDDLGKPVGDGTYYFLIDYTIGGKTFTHDPRSVDGYRETIPTRSWTPTFNPYREKFVDVTYSLPKPAEVSLYFWTRDYSRSDTIAPVRTLLSRQPQGEGPHTVTWDGVDDRGVVVKAADYPVTLLAYELPDSAIVVTGGRPEVSAVAAEPNFFSTGYNPYGAQATGQTTVSFVLSRAADVEVRVVDSGGAVVKSMVKTKLPAGANAVVWNGQDQSGNPVPPGSYSIGLTALDSAGHRSLRHHAVVAVCD